MTAQTFVNAEVLVRDGANGFQAMWVAFKDPQTNEVVTAWGVAKTTTGERPRLYPGVRPSAALAFSNSKKVSGDSLAALYEKKMKKYLPIGRFDIDTTSLYASLPGAAAERAGGEPEKQPLPKSLTHPESLTTGNSSSASWFY